MSKHPNGGPAFPSELGVNFERGMSKRELYALGALIGWGAGRNNGDTFNNSQASDPAHVAESCFAYADAFIAESEKP